MSPSRKSPNFVVIAKLIIYQDWVTRFLFFIKVVKLYNIIKTCLANDIAPRDYFMYIFKHMPQEATLNDDTVQKYLPWNTPMYLKDK